MVELPMPRNGKRVKIESDFGISPQILVIYG
jgi:hypothetical protein